MKLAAMLPVVTVAALVGAAAHATPNFPPEIASHLALAAPPQCKLCHQGGVTGKGTVTTPFGTSMRAQGLVEFDTGALRSALDALSAAGTDSDGDCVGDIAELRAGTDPDTPDNPDAGACDHGESAAVSGAPPPPRYGCEARVSARAPEGGFLVTFALALSLRIRRRAGAPSRTGSSAARAPTRAPPGPRSRRAL